MLPSSLGELLALARKLGLSGRYQSKRPTKEWIGRVVVGGRVFEGRGSDRRAALNRAAEQAMFELRRGGTAITMSPSADDARARQYAATKIEDHKLERQALKARRRRGSNGGFGEDW